MRGHPQVPYPVAGVGQKVAYTATAGTSSAVAAQTRAVIVWVSTDAYISFEGTATTSDTPIPANTPMLFRIQGGQTVSAVQDAAGGNLFVGEVDV